MQHATVFHCIDILPRDEIVLTENDNEKEVIYDDGAEEGARQNFSATRSQLIIHIFGRTADGRQVAIDVEGFCPYFYVAAPELGPAQLRSAQRQLADYVERFGQRNVRIQLEFREKFYGFTNHTNFPFFRLTVPSLMEFRRLKNLFLDGELRPQVRARIGSLWAGAPQIFEANIDPELRFLHERNLQPCGWITVPTEIGDEPVRLHYTELDPATAPAATAPFVAISWDLECYSANGLFPLAKKNYAQVAKEFCMRAYKGEEAVGHLETMLFDRRGPLTLMQLKHRLAPDARPTYQRLMMRPAVYKAIDAGVAEYATATNNEERDEITGRLASTIDGQLGVRFALAGDPCIQIGSVVSVGSTTTERHVFVWPSCDPIDGAIVHEAPDEASMWRAWFEWLEYMNPDIMMGYNTSNFDERYVWNRAEELGLEDHLSFLALNRLEGGEMRLNEQRLSSSALGDNFLYLLNMQGRLDIDLFSFIKAKEKLDSYKLDSVAKHYMSGSLVQCDQMTEEKQATLKVKGAVRDCRPGRALVLLDEVGDTMTQKLIIEEVDGDVLTVRIQEADHDAWNDDVTTNAKRWVIVKDDIGPADIFRLHEGSAADRAVVAKYCIQDCDLVLDLYRKLEVFVNSMAMANVCSVPVRYIFTRGQGIKIESLIFKECTELNKCILTLPRPVGGDESYDGAIVLEPEPGLYSRSPIGVGDFASLYPSSIVSENISHDTLIWSKDYKDDGTFMRMSYGSEEYDGATVLGGSPVPWTDIKFDIKVPDPEDKRKNPKKIKIGYRVCRYAQDQPGTLPIIIKKLLAARNAKKKEMGREPDLLRKILLDGEQLAYKLTANALYGQLGSRTFKVRLQDLAASTTAYGRQQIMFAKEVIETFYGAGRDSRCAARIIYGDTDSLFIEWNPKGPDGRPLEGREARAASIELTEESGHLVSQALKAPHDFEFDKVYHPFLIFSKKRYAGHLFDSNPDDYYTMYMGIALRRRDSAPIVKAIYGQALKEVLLTGNVVRAQEIVREGVMALAQGKVKMGLLTMSQSLKAEYENPQSIAHKVLADRMAARDPGTAPTVGDRVPYVFIKAPGAKLKGDMIESPAYVRDKGLDIDAKHYIQKQLEVPISQMFGVLLERMTGFTADMVPHIDLVKTRKELTEEEMEELVQTKVIAAREAAAAKLLFGEALRFIEGVSKRAGFEKLFGGKATITATAKPARVAAPAAAVAARPVQKQARLTAFVSNKQLHEALSGRRKSRSRDSSVSNTSKGSANSK